MVAIIGFHIRNKGCFISSPLHTARALGRPTLSRLLLMYRCQRSFVVKHCATKYPTRARMPLAACFTRCAIPAMKALEQLVGNAQACLMYQASVATYSTPSAAETPNQLAYLKTSSHCRFYNDGRIPWGGLLSLACRAYHRSPGIVALPEMLLSASLTSSECRHACSAHLI